MIVVSATVEQHDYIYASGKLLRETITTTAADGTVTTEVLDFFYDENGTPYAFKYNDVQYYYITNLQGDVLYITDSTGTTVGTYDYDPFGKIISQTGDIAEVNPLRYRGYYSDTETGFYYLQSRYYDPTIARFINADSYASTGQGIIGHNMFAYCGNNPVCNIDFTGTFRVSFIELSYSDDSDFVPIVVRVINTVRDLIAVNEDKHLTSGEMKVNATLIYCYLSQRGWSHNAICATLGNMQAESTINPGRHQVGGAAYGLVQWDPATKYTDWAAANGYANDSLTGQLIFLNYSIQPGKGEWFRNSRHPDYYLSSSDFVCSNQSVDYLVAVFMYSYERPGVEALDLRIQYANYWSDYFS